MGVSDAGFEVGLDLAGVGPDRRQAIEEHQRLGRLFEKAIDSLAEHLEEVQPGVFSARCGTDRRPGRREHIAQHERLRDLFEKATRSLAERLEDLEPEGHA